MGLEIEDVAIDRLRPSKRNARTHSPRQLKLLKKSVAQFGFNAPIIIDDADNILAGHARYEVAKNLRMPSVPCVRLLHLSPAEARAYLLADNRIAELAGWDWEILAAELDELSVQNFDIEVTGFEHAEIDQILFQAQKAKPSGTDKFDKVPARQSGTVITQCGHVWQLGRHRLKCGDATNAADMQGLMGWDEAIAMFTDPPYNVAIRNIVGLGRTKHREFQQASGEMTRDEFVAFLTSTLGNAVRFCRDGAICFVMMDWRHMAEMLEAGNAVFYTFKNLCVWAKTNAGMGSLYRSQHELAFVWKVGEAPHINNIELGRHGRHRSNVWQYAGVNSFRAGRMEELSSHPTVKPMALVADAIRDVTNRGDIVLDPFGGSGTTLIAAEQTGRTARLMEIDPVYCDVIVRRFQKLTGKNAVLAGSGGTTFDELALARKEEGKAMEPA